MLPEGRQAVAINAASATNGATITSSVIDTVNPDGSKSEFATIDLIATTQAATNGNPTVLKLQECDTTVATSFADVVAFVGGTAVDSTHGFVIPNGVTSGNNAYKFNVDLRGRKRYLSLVVSPVTTQTFSAIANLFRNGQMTNTAAKANVLALVEG